MRTEIGWLDVALTVVTFMTLLVIIIIINGVKKINQKIYSQPQMQEVKCIR